MPLPPPPPPPENIDDASLLLPQEDLVKDRAYENFIKHLRWREMPARQRALAGFVLTSIMDGYHAGQEACLNKRLLPHACLELLEDAAGEVSRLFSVGFSCWFTMFQFNVCVPICVDRTHVVMYL